MAHRPGTYDKKQFRALTKLLDGVCVDLGISPDNQAKREMVAMVMFGMFRTGSLRPLGIATQRRGLQSPRHSSKIGAAI